MYRTPTGRPTFPGIGVIGVKSWQKTRKNRGQSESSPRCLNAVNPAVALSAAKYEVPEKTCGKRTPWLTGAPGSPWLLTYAHGSVQVWDSILGKPISPPVDVPQEAGVLHLACGNRRLAVFLESGHALVFDLAPLTVNIRFSRSVGNNSDRSAPFPLPTALGLRLLGEREQWTAGVTRCP